MSWSTRGDYADAAGGEVWCRQLDKTSAGRLAWVGRGTGCRRKGAGGRRRPDEHGPLVGKKKRVARDIGCSAKMGQQAR